MAAASPVPKLVDAHADRAAQVGDEALLLARVAPTIVARDRVAGAQAARAAGASVVIMDDGLQNASLAKDFTFAVVDGRRGIGNARVFPAGPLRAPLDAQLARSDALLIVGERSTRATSLSPQAPCRFFMAGWCLMLPRLRRSRAVMFWPSPASAIRRSFSPTLTQAGIAVAQRKAFGDHHRFIRREEAAQLVMQAEHDGLTLLTTEKDHARMAGEPALAALAARAQVLPVTLVVDEADELRALVLAKIRK